MKDLAYCLLGILLSLLCTNYAIADINVKKINKTQWHAIETDNFSVITDAGERKGLEIAGELERFRFFISHILGYKQNPQPSRIRVFVAKSNSTYNAWGINKEFSGVYVGDGQNITFFANAKGFSTGSSGKASEGRHVILHELVHMLMYNSEVRNVLGIPTWYSEGIAEYFATYVEKKGKIYLGDMSLMSNRFYSLWRGDRIISIDSGELIHTGYHDRIENANRRDRLFLSKYYARSFALVHYLNSSPELRKQLIGYLYVLKQGFPIDKSFKAAFGVGFNEMDQAVYKYLNSKLVSVRIFDIGKGGVMFPEFDKRVVKLASRDLFTILIPNLQLLPEALLQEADKQKMYDDVEKLYPNFFE